MMDGKGAGLRVKSNGENSGRSGLDGWGHPTVKELVRPCLTFRGVCRQEAVEVRSWQSRTANKEGIKGFQGGGWQKGSWK
jgi:hypothetical protein